jgi:hypothetical protein
VRHLAGGMSQFGCLSRIFCPISGSPDGAAVECLDVHLERAEPIVTISGENFAPCSWQAACVRLCGVADGAVSLARRSYTSVWGGENGANIDLGGVRGESGAGGVGDGLLLVLFECQVREAKKKKTV